MRDRSSTVRCARSIRCIRLPVVLALLAGLGSWPAAADGDRAKPCSERSLRGTYGYSYTGDVDGFGRIAAVGPIRFDGAGRTEADYSVNLGGVHFEGRFSGHYAIARDCSGQITIDLPLLGFSSDGSFVVVDGGREAFFKGDDAGVTVTGVARRLAR